MAYAAHLPLLHRGGTNPDELIENLCNARQAVDAAIDALNLAAPHGRDYVGLVAGMKKATDMHARRVAILTELSKSLSDDLLSIAASHSRTS